MPDQSPEWIREALQLYFVDRPGIHVDHVDLIGYFHVASVLDAAEDLVRAGWVGQDRWALPQTHALQCLTPTHPAP